MKITNDRIVQISRGETLTLRSNKAELNLLNRKIAAGSELSIEAPRSGSLHRITAISGGISDLTVTSSSGQHWATTLFPGTNLFEFVLEPQADEWHCENDDGNPPHPVSKGEDKCPICGGKVIHGGK